MTIVSTIVNSNLPGHRLAKLKGAGRSQLTPLAIAGKANTILQGLGPGFEMLVSIQLHGLGWRTPGKGFIPDGVILESLVRNPEENDAVDFADGSAGEHPMGRIDNASFLVRRV